MPESQDETEQATEDALLVVQREIEQVEQVIGLERKKLEMLTRLRAGLLGTQTTPKTKDHPLSSKLEELLDKGATTWGWSPKMSGAEDVSEDGMPVRRYQRQGGVHESVENAEVLVHRGSLAANSSVSRVEIFPFRLRSTRRSSSRRDRKGVPFMGSFLNVIFLIDEPGNLLFFDSDGNTLAQVSAESMASVFTEKSQVTSVSFEPGANSIEVPLLALGTTEGEVVLLNLTLWNKDSVVAGRRVAIKKDPETGEILPGQQLPPQPSFRTPEGHGLVVDVESVIQLPPTEDDTPRAITAMHLHTSRSGSQTSSRRMVAVGDDSGMLWNFDRNGTELGSTNLQQGAARDIRRSGTLLAVAEDRGVVFVSATKLTFSKIFCKGGQSPVTSIAFDVLSPTTLYVAFENGDVVVFNSKAKSEKSVTCRKTLKIPHTADAGTGVRLWTTRGYLLATSARWGLQVYNTTSVRELGIRLVGRSSPSPLQSNDGAAPAAAVSVVPGLRVPEVLVAVDSIAAIGSFLAGPDASGEPSPPSGPGESFQLFDALLPYDPPTNDISWLRMPMLLGGLVIVFGYQMLRGKRPRGGRRGRRGGRGSSGGRGMDDIDVGDLDETFDSDAGAGFDMSRYGGRNKARFR
mmetsp:Transcript_3712/g.10882  ORF Transcript_3712/g.10882 Transcript_3712/m.10882 type:complete len:631 (-) Transcript_3712:224-2116(-)